MSFTSYTFLLFTAALLAVYYWIPRKTQWILLLTASGLFYLWAGLSYLVFLLFTIFSTYLATWRMGRNLQKRDEMLPGLPKEEKKTVKQRVKQKNRRWMLLCILLNFTILAFCKALLIDPFRTMAQEKTISFLSLGLPLGISFYMFQSMGYVMDVYRETVKPEGNLGKLALFVSFFPQLIQGPISRFSQLAPQLYAPHDYDGKQVAFGIQRMLWGYFKKLVVADRLAPAVLALRGMEGGGPFLLLTFLYALQIYGDFSGGIDIAIGLAEAMGITMTENFVRPYFSKNISEFWRRWHITLGEWMKNYIFYPISISSSMRRLSKSLRKKWDRFGKQAPVYVGSMAVWLVTGVWHGFSANFLVWGMLNCAVIILSQELTPLYERFHGRFHLKEKKWYGGFEILRTFCMMNLIQVCDLFPYVGDYFHRIFSVFTDPNLRFFRLESLLSLGLTGLDCGILAGAVILILSVSLIQETRGSVRELLWQKPALLRRSLYFLLLAAVLLMGIYGIGYNASNFIYNQF